MEKQFVLLSLFVFVVFCFDSIAAKEKVDFSAKVENVRLQTELIEQGKTYDSIVTVTVLAEKFEKPLVIKDVRTEGKHKIPEIDKIIKYHKAMSEGNPKKISEFWHPDERPGTLELINDPEVLSNMKAQINADPSLKVLSVIYQNGSSSVLVPLYPEIVIGYSLRKYKDKLYLSNKPSDDLELAIVEASYME